MKEVDPEVAALLEDLPKSKLPPALIKEGWGQHAMRDLFKSPKAPSTVQQPVYENTCFQCGRPLTMRSSRWVDHSGKDNCDGGAVAEQEFPNHVIESEIEFSRDLIRRSKERDEQRQAQRMAAAARQDLVPPRVRVKMQWCHAKKKVAGTAHECRCEYPFAHFGFHECVGCRRLWR
jgi:hypothetical protein